MKRKRKQLVISDGKRSLVDVPEDDILYQLDCHAEYLRSRGLKFETSLEDVSYYICSPRESQPEYIVEQMDLKRRLAVALSHLSDAERQLLRWRFEEELRQAEIAHRMGCSQQKVSRELQQILLKLRAELQD